jgi:hypothetical protein
VVKVSEGATALAAEWNPASGGLYARLTADYAAAQRDALQQHRVTLRPVAFFWMQGESDATNAAFAAAYRDNMTNLIARVQSDIGAMPFYVGRIHNRLPTGTFPYADTVRTAQTNDQGAWTWIDTDAMTNDTVHFYGAGLTNLGATFVRTAGL